MTMCLYEQAIIEAAKYLNKLPAKEFCGMQVYLSNRISTKYTIDKSKTFHDLITAYIKEVDEGMGI